MAKSTQPSTGGNFFQSVKGKTVSIGILGIIAALIIGIGGLASVSKNAQNSEVVSQVNQISVLQSNNLANDALYQYYVDDSYLTSALGNLDEMEQQALSLQKTADATISGSVSAILENVAADKENYNEILGIHSERGYDPSIGKYQEFIASSTALSESFQSLVNQNSWIEIPWMNQAAGVESVEVDGTSYNMAVYHNTLPIAGKRNNIVVRLGGTFTYQTVYYVKNLKLIDGSSELPIDLSLIEKFEKSGDGLGDVEITTFGGEPALKITGVFNAANERWEEVAVTLPITEYDIENYPEFYYEMYLDPVASEGQSYQYGGAVSGVYDFAGSLSTLDNMMASYSRLVVEGKDVSASLAEIEALISELETNIPKYTTDPSLADASLSLLATKKDLFEQIKSIDTQTLAIKAENAEINAALSELCTTVQNQAVANMTSLRKTVTAVILFVLVVAIIILVAILTRVSHGINKSVTSFRNALEQITTGNLTARASVSGNDEFATFSKSLNNFMDTLEGTIKKVKEMTDVLADSGIALEDSAIKTKQVAGEVSNTIAEISKGAGEQASDIEVSSQKVLEMRSNIDQILGSVTELADRSDEMIASGKAATDTMSGLTRSSDQTTDAFENIAAQVRKTDESVGKIQEAVSLIASVANQINLLSLNASIEAARAGDAGRGFAVVATEISKLADQTNQSAAIIDQIIQMLSAESAKTVETIGEVTEMIQGQKGSIDTTSEKFGVVETGIDFTKTAVRTVLGQAQSCESAGSTVVDLMTNLSAISEENAASA
ncbi:MAG: methyl-accepting chemotaxis protein, partial [Lachnospiraceae bacterium]|nr:methyl-accepting chemotaxis protein [Lachnospiraceae bacterium]